MANELRVRQNFLGGLIEDNPLTSGATTLTSAGLASMVAIGTSQHMPITLDPDGLFGEPEIVWVTAHTAAATTATILRGQEGTTARAHTRDVEWAHGHTAKDANEGMRLIYETTLASAAASVNITSIPQTYRHLVLYLMARSDATNAAGPYGVRAQFNGDTAANYDGVYIRGNASSASGAASAGQSSIPVGLIDTDLDTTGRASANKMEVLDYTSTSWHKATVGFAATYATSSAGNIFMDVRSGLWRSTAAITSILVFNDSLGSFKAGSTFSLYGVK